MLTLALALRWLVVLDLLPVVPAATTVAASAASASTVMVSKRPQGTAAEQQSRYGERGHHRQTSGSGHSTPSGANLIFLQRGRARACYGQAGLCGNSSVNAT